MKTIAIVMSIDTKEEEASFLKQYIERNGQRALIIDISASGNYEPKSFVPDISREEVCKEGGTDPAMLTSMKKNEAIQAMMSGIETIMPRLYSESRFDAVISAGGLQNTITAVGAMKTLPIGVPKVMVSTVACGERKFEPFVGIKDIIMIPSIADISGINTVTKTILSNGASAIIGMAREAKPLIRDGKLRVGVTMMGVTNNSAAQAVRILERNGVEVVSFHSTGVGGRCFEYLIQEGIIGAAIDLSLHEVVSADVFGCGFSNGAPGRLIAGARAGIPMVVAPGALDFIDLYVEDFKNGAIGDYTKRKYTLHNNLVAHIKLFADESKKAAELVAERLNSAKGPVTVIFPLRGLRTESQLGQKLYDPEVDNIILDTLRKNLDRKIRRVEVDANINDMLFSKTIAQEMLELIRDI